MKAIEVLPILKEKVAFLSGEPVENLVKDEKFWHERCFGLISL